MRIVVPISRSDVNLLPEFVEIHQKLKCGTSHQLHFVVPSTIESEAHDAKASLTGFFESITIHSMDFEPMGGWPYAPNMHFWACANFMAKDNKNIPWQLVELDCRPLYQRTYDAVASKYASCGVPFFGNVDKTPWRVNEKTDEAGHPVPNYGKIVSSRFGDMDVMMSGCAVYPGGMILMEHFTGLMQDFMKGQDSTDEAWDMHLRAPMQVAGMAGTQMIAQHWNTVNYRIVNGRILCDARDTHEIFERNPEWEKRKCGGYVHTDAVMIHGCKDDSLYQLIMSGQIPETMGLPTPVVVPAVSQTVSSSSSTVSATPAIDDARFARLESMVEKLAMLALNKDSAPPDGMQGEPASAQKQGSPPVSPAVVQAHETKVDADSILGQLAEMIQGGRAMRLSEVATKLRQKASDLRPIIEGSELFTIQGPASWVKRKAA